MVANVIVTSALPYANGPVHFGHIVGAYLPADIYVRFRRMCGDRVHFVCGTDEHGVAITLKAEQSGESYQSYVDRWHDEISRLLGQVGIQFDIFSGTSDHRNPYHRELVQKFFEDLRANGLLLERTEDHYYSSNSKRFLPDRYIEGTCYECGHEGARGDECPGCGAWLDAKKLLHPRSTVDGTTPILKPSKHWYLDLPAIRDDWLQGWFDSKAGGWKINVRNFVKSALRELRERPITRDLPWGVPVPLADAKGKVLYVWFDAPIGYLSISQQHFAERGEPDEFEKLWKSADTELYHFIGKDNITFHVVVFPAMLWGTQAGWILPTNVPANEFFNLEGRKFNTSEGWYISEDSAAGRCPVDALRYALVTMMPETADSDWSWREFQARVNDDLADNFGNFVARTLRFVDRFLDGAIPPAGDARPQDRDVLAAAEAATDEMAAALRRFEFRGACQRLMALGNECNRYFDRQQPWATRKSDHRACQQTMRTCCELIRSLAILCRPIMPATSTKLLRALGLDEAPRIADAATPGLPPEPIAIEPLPVLFPKVTDEEIETEIEKLQALARRAGQPPSRYRPLAPVIEHDTFAAVDMRAGTILEATKHPQADRLIVCKVDLGFETRTVVAGVAEAYGPEDLVGRRVIVVANLSPRKLRGIESRGMMLAAEDESGRPRFLAPGPDTRNGARVT